ncbi:MAG: MBG domain-containing protein, partial [Isosphaeraceae bacterium]
MQPTSQIPAPGSQFSFTVSTSDIYGQKATQTASFTVPEIDAVTLTSDPPSMNAAPGATATDSVTITNAGNVPENVMLSASATSGLTVAGLSDVSLQPGQSATESVALTPDAATPLNSFLQATITATFGPSDSPQTQTLQIPVDVVVPGALAIAGATASANQLNEGALAARLGDLGIAITNLVQDTTNAVFESQALASLDAVIALLAGDVYLPNLAGALTTDRATLAQATTAADINNALSSLGNDLNSLATTLSDEIAHSLTLQLDPNQGQARPQVPVLYPIDIQNTGTQATTYDFSVSGLPSGVTASFNHPSVTLQPGQDLFGGPNGIVLTLTETAGELTPTGFTVTATAEGAPEISRSAAGSLTVRNAFVQVASVTPSPSFTNPGGQVDVSASVLNVVGQQIQAQAFYTVTDPSGTVVFTSTPVALTLTTFVSLMTVDLGSFNTTGLANGSYLINVMVTDTAGNPLTGVAGQGSLLIGSPVTASLSLNSTTAVPNLSVPQTYTNTLKVDTQASFPAPLTLDGVAATDAPESSVALDGTLAYVAGIKDVSIVDLSDPSNPQVRGTFGSDVLTPGNFNVCQVAGDLLLVASQNLVNTPFFNLLIYSIADPLHPTLLSNTTFNYQFVSDLFVQGTTAFIPISGVTYFVNTVLTDQYGDFLAVDFSDPTKPTLQDVLFNNRGTPDGSDHNVNGGVAVNSQTTYVATTTSAGGNSQSGTGELLIVDTTDPSHMAVAGTLAIPDTIQVLDVAIQGNRALAVGSTGGWISAASGGLSNAKLTGNFTLTPLDISDPLHPKIIGPTLVTQDQFFTEGANLFAGKVAVVGLGNGVYAVSDTQLNGNPVLLLVDSNDPNNMIVGATQTPSPVNGMTVSGSLLYVAGQDGLSDYNIGQVLGVPVTVSVEVPNAADTAYDPTSFNIAPSQIVHGTGFDTITWNSSLGAGATDLTLTWTSALTNLQPGEARAVTLGATVNFVSQGTPGSITLPGTVVDVSHDSLFFVSPTSQTVQPGAAATYTITVENSQTTAVTYNFSVTGVPAAWVSVPATVTVPPLSPSQVTLTIVSDPAAPVGNYGFTVAVSVGGLADSAPASLILQGQPVVAPIDPDSHGVVATLIPTQASAGQGTPANYVVQVTNTGSADDTFTLSAAGLPPGVAATLGQTTIDVPPGASNFRDVPLTLTPAAGTPPGDIPFQVVATSTTVASVSGTTSGTLTVVANGVNVNLNPSSGNPGSAFEMFVYNTGTVQDTFDLSLGGPAALVSSLATDQVTLSPGRYQYVAITTNPVSFADPGTLELTATATSEGNPNVQDSARAELNIAPTQGMTAQFQQPTQVIPLPGTSDFLLLVNNTGNMQDSYSATIIGTTGPVTASLTGLDGNPTQSIPEFILPGLSTGAIVLQTDLAATGQGTVTIEVQSLSNPNETATATATVSATATSTPIQPVIQLAASPGSTTTYGQSVSFTATVGPPASGDPTPTGSVQFQIDGSNFGSPVTLDSNGSATSDPISALTAAGHTITALYSGDPTYAQGSQTLTQTVNPATPTVNVSAPNVTYDAAPYHALSSSVTGVNNANLGAASSFTYYAGMGIGGTDLGSTAPTAAGTYTVVAYYAGSADYAAADSVPTSFTIAPQAITVTANPETKVYGTADPALTYQITSGSLAGTDTLTGSLTRAPGENVGSYAIGQGTLSAGLNYDLTFVAADLMITPATLAVAAGNLDINHGDSIPTPGYTVTGFVRGDTQAVLSGAPSFSTPPNANNAAGVYPITIGQGSLAATNYVFQLVAGSLTVHPKVTDVDIQWGKQTMSIMNLHRDLPFTNITAIDIIFSDDVTVTKSDLTLTGVNVPLYSFSGF